MDARIELWNANCGRESRIKLIGLHSLDFLSNVFRQIVAALKALKLSQVRYRHRHRNFMYIGAIIDVRNYLTADSPTSHSRKSREISFTPVTRFARFRKALSQLSNCRRSQGR